MITAIVAVDKNWAIGGLNKEGKPDLLFKLPKDLTWFKEKTLSSVVVMGMTTYQSLPKKPLPKRINVVLWDQLPEEVKTENDTIFFRTFEALVSFLKIINDVLEIYICGGGYFYKSCIEAGIVDRVYVTKVYAEAENPTAYFPNLDENKNYKIVDAFSSAIDNGLKTKIFVYDKI